MHHARSAFRAERAAVIGRESATALIGAARPHGEEGEGAAAGAPAVEAMAKPGAQWLAAERETHRAAKAPAMTKVLVHVRIRWRSAAQILRVLQQDFAVGA